MVSIFALEKIMFPICITDIAIAAVLNAASGLGPPINPRQPRSSRLLAKVLYSL